MSDDIRAYVSRLNHDYEVLHTAKEDAFWSAYMGLTPDKPAARKLLEHQEIALQRWLRDPERLAEAERMLAAAEAGTVTEDELVALRGWVKTLSAHSIPSEEARDLAEAIVGLEGNLAQARGAMELGFAVDGAFEEASSVKLGLMVRTDPESTRRQAAWEGLRSIEDHVLANGFIDVVKSRNRLGKMLGGEDFYDWTVQRVEGLSKREIFDVLDELEELTRDRARESLETLREEHGDALTPWNIQFLISGDVTAEVDPYFPFANSVDVWARSFAGLGIGYRDAEMVLDLVDRKGKYENGFMHGPVPAWRDGDAHRPARIQFTANAVPGQVGSGMRALQTLLHEGGHAAHFANIDMPSPCFAQEFAPTSVAFAETQSMFLDSLLNDADWQRRYARNEAGEPIPVELIKKSIRVKQPAAAWQLRAMMVVPYAERAIYELPESELTAERILETVQEVERRFTFLDRSPRPTLCGPHLLSGESSAYYHGYVLADIAVHQTRAFFIERDGHLVDNPCIGRDLARVYWRPGNSRSFKEFVHALTGQPLSARYLAEHANRTVDQALATMERQLEKLDEIPAPSESLELGAKVRVVHGNTLIATTARGGFSGLAEEFARWIRGLETAA
ncbi:MAG: M3 family metallopeptidase [Myxococcota bacterium]